MSAADLLSRLEAVRQVGRDRWRARCPAHGGRNANTLSVGEASDGTVLIHCFAGCSVAEVVAALGLDLADLFPRSDWSSTGQHAARPRRPRVDWAALITTCERDLLLTRIALATIGAGDDLDSSDRAACSAAAGRVLQVITEARLA